MNTATSETLIDSTVKPIFARARAAPPPAAACPLLEVARDVLEHDDGIVDDEPGRDGQRHQRQVVEAVAGRYITPNVPISDTGTATLGISVARTLRRNSEHHQRSPAPPRSPASARRRAARRGWSACGPAPRRGRWRAGSRRCSCGSSSRMRSTVSMMLAPGCRKMISSTAGLPFDEPGVADVLAPNRRRRPRR